VGDESKRLERRQRDRDDVEICGVEALGEQIHGCTLAAPALGNNHGDRVTLDREAKAAEDFVEGGVHQEGFAVGGLGERWVVSSNTLRGS